METWVTIFVVVSGLICVTMCIGVCREINRWAAAWLLAEKAEMGCLTDEERAAI